VPKKSNEIPKKKGPVQAVIAGERRAKKGKDWPLEHLALNGLGRGKTKSRPNVLQKRGEAENVLRPPGGVSEGGSKKGKVRLYYQEKPEFPNEGGKQYSEIWKGWERPLLHSQAPCPSRRKAEPVLDKPTGRGSSYPQKSPVVLMADRQGKKKKIPGNSSPQEKGKGEPAMDGKTRKEKMLATFRKKKNTNEVAGPFLGEKKNGRPRRKNADRGGPGKKGILQTYEKSRRKRGKKKKKKKGRAGPGQGQRFGEGEVQKKKKPCNFRRKGCGQSLGGGKEQLKKIANARAGCGRGSPPQKKKRQVGRGKEK